MSKKKRKKKKESLGGEGRQGTRADCAPGSPIQEYPRGRELAASDDFCKLAGVGSFKANQMLKPNIKVAGEIPRQMEIRPGMKKVRGPKRGPESPLRGATRPSRMPVRNNFNSSCLMEFGAWHLAVKGRRQSGGRQGDNGRVRLETSRRDRRRELRLAELETAHSSANSMRQNNNSKSNQLQSGPGLVLAVLLLSFNLLVPQFSSGSARAETSARYIPRLNDDNNEFGQSRASNQISLIVDSKLLGGRTDASPGSPAAAATGQASEVLMGSSEWSLDSRQFEAVPTDLLCTTFKGDFGSQLSMLSLANNNIKTIENASFKCLGETLKIIFLQENQISSLNGSPFDGLNKLQVLRLSDNQLSQIPPAILFEPLKSLRHLDLSQNKIESIPADAFPKRGHYGPSVAILSNLISLNLKGNPIHLISSRAFVGLAKLKTLTLSETSLNDTTWPASGGFEGLEEMRFLYADRMRGDFAFRSREPSDFCSNSPKLSSLVLKSNQLDQATQFVHSKHCQSLLLLDLSYNRIGPQLGAEQPFRGLSNLIDLYLSHNFISSLEENDFLGLSRLQVLELGSNKIVSINARTFWPLRHSLTQLDIANNVQLTELPKLGLERIQSLSCFGNPQLRDLPHFKRARTLMLTFAYHCCVYANSELEEASAASKSWQIDLHESSVATTRQDGPNSVHRQPNSISNFNPKRNPSSSSSSAAAQSGFIALDDLVIWSPQQETTTRDPVAQENKSISRVIKSRRDSSSGGSRTKNPLIERIAWEIGRIRGLHKASLLDHSNHYNWLHEMNHDWPPEQSVQSEQYEDELSSDEVGRLVAEKLSSDQEYTPLDPSSRSKRQDYSLSHHFNENNSNNFSSHSINCQPKPNAFFPCRDLFDTWWLRLGIWCVFPLGLIGNFLVIIVLSSVKPSSSTSALTSIMWLAHSKRHIDVPRFLVINLAIADLLMALYLGLLAIVDLTTCGQFRLYAIKWQFSIGCQVAGFLAILSSELSVFILAIITLERNYAITNAVHLNRRLSLQRAMLIMFLGYAFAIAMALLPLQGVNDYRKYSICLPLDLDPHKPSSQIYVITLLGMNSFSFALLFGCYLRMYCAIRGSQAWNTNDLRIAKRMSILVMTDFLCWSPIIISAIGALVGHRLVDTTGIKIMTIFILPLNSIANPFLYAITTRKFKRDLDNLLYQIRYILSFGHYAKRPPNAHQMNNNNFNNKHNQHWNAGNQLQHHHQQQPYGTLSNKFHPSGQQHIIITCHQNNQQRIRRLKLNHNHHKTEKRHNENTGKLDNNNGLMVNGETTLGAGIRHHQRKKLELNNINNNTTFNQVTMNRTSCCNNSSNADIPSWQQQDIVYGAIDPTDEHVIIMQPDDCNNDENVDLIQHQQPRIVFDYDDLEKSAMNDHDPGDCGQPENKRANFGGANRSLAPKMMAGATNNNNPSINNSLTTSEAGTIKTNNSGFSLKSYYNSLIGRPLPSSSLSVACKGTSDNQFKETTIQRQRPRSALGNIPSNENERGEQQADLLGICNNGTSMIGGNPSCRCAHSNDTFHRSMRFHQSNKRTKNQQNATGSLGFGGSDDLASCCWNGDPDLRQQQNNEQRPQTPLPGQKSGKRRMRFKPLARAWSSLQISLANRNASTSISNSLIQQQQQQQVQPQATLRSTSPHSIISNNNCCELHDEEIEQLQLIEQSSGEHSKLGFEDLMDLELHLDEIFEMTNSPYLLLINPKRLGERRMSRSCETVSHHNSPLHNNINSNTNAKFQQENDQTTHSFDQEQLGYLGRTSATISSQKERQKRFSSTLQPSEISTTTTTTNTSSHIDEDDQRVLLATINQLASRSKRARYRGKRKRVDNERELRLLGNPSRSTRCRSWSPALLGKLEDCIGQIRQRLPAIASPSAISEPFRERKTNMNGNRNDIHDQRCREQLCCETRGENLDSNSSNSEKLIDLGELDEDGSIATETVESAETVKSNYKQ